MGVNDYIGDVVDMKYLIVLFFVACGSNPFPSEIPMNCSTPYGQLNTTVFVDGSILSYSINENQTLILTKKAQYVDEEMWQVIRKLKYNETSLTEYSDGRIVLISTGVVCNLN